MLGYGEAKKILLRTLAAIFQKTDGSWNRLSSPRRRAVVEPEAWRIGHVPYCRILRQACYFEGCARVLVTFLQIGT